MPKTKISEWSSTPANNTDIDSINIAEGCAPSGINDAIRELMAQVKDLYSGTTGDAIGVAGGGTGQTSYTNGQLLIGNTTGNTLTKATLTAGTGISITNGGGSISIAATGSVSAATPTALGTVYGKQTTSGASPYLTAYGYEAGRSTTGANATAVGLNALYTNVSGVSCTAVGYQALYANTANSNTAIGANALLVNTTGAGVAVGSGAGQSNTTGIILAIGTGVCAANTTGIGNTAVGSTGTGYTAPSSVNSTGNYNSAFGEGTLANNTNSNNTALGAIALYTNTSGTNNTAVGQSALYNNSTGDNSVAVGTQAGNAATTGGYNTFIGRAAGLTCTTGVSNTIVGGYAASNTLTTGSRNTYLGYGLTPSGAAVTEEIIIAGGGGGTGKGSSTGFINPATGGVYQGNNSSLWSVTSDQRLKKNIVDNNTGLDKLTQIQVRNFEYRTEDEITELPKDQAIKKTGIQLGVIAQELQAVLPECIKTESTGVMSVDADNLTWYMINAIKELKAEVDSLKSQLQGN